LEADVDASDAFVVAVVALDAADVALFAALVSLVPAFVALVAAFVSDVAAAVSLAAAAVALEAAAVADVAAADAEVVADAASTNNAHLPLSVFVVRGWEPDDVWDVVQINMLFVLVSFTMSRALYDVDAAQSPTNVPSSCVTLISPLLSNARILLARSVAPTVNSVEVIVFVRDSLIARSISSCCCCAINVRLSSASSCEAAGNGSLGV